MGVDLGVFVDGFGDSNISTKTPQEKAIHPNFSTIHKVHCHLLLAVPYF
jgi:hypothetical protein